MVQMKIGRFKNSTFWAGITNAFIKSAILKFNFKLGRAIEKKKLLSFISLVMPVTTNHELIRLGGEGDGGYLIPNDIENVEVCFSPGVSNTSDFEFDLTNYGIKCYLADYSVDKPSKDNKLFDFEKKYLGNRNNEVFMTLEDWVSRKEPNRSDFILQMDIEGSEYATLYEASPDLLRKFRILLIEFHDLDCLFDKVGFELISLTFEKLLKDFEIVHIHPNNCNKPIVFEGIAIPPVMEFTFLRKDRIFSKVFTSSFPHELDRKNVPDNEDVLLPQCWFLSL